MDFNRPEGGKKSAPPSGRMMESWQQALFERDRAIEELSRTNQFLKSQNDALTNLLTNRTSGLGLPTVMDLGYRLEQDKLFSLKRFTIDCLPVRGVCSVLKRQYFMTMASLDNVIDPITFDREYETMWSNIIGHRMAPLDMNFMALVLIVIAIALRTSSEDMMLSSEVLLRQWRTPESVHSSCTQWFSTSRQVLSFYHVDDMVRHQVLSLQTLFCHLTCDYLSMDQLISQRAFESMSIGLDDPRVSKFGGQGRLLWWELCFIDTERSLLTGKDPRIRSYRSQIPIHTFDKGSYAVKLETDFPVYYSEQCKIINRVFEIDPMEQSSKKLKLLLDIDQKLVDHYNNVNSKQSIQKNKASRFHKNIFHLKVNIHRYRLFESFLEHRIPVCMEICYIVCRDMFNAYKELKQRFIASQDPMFIPQLPHLIHGAIILNACLLYHPELKDKERELLIEDSNMVRNDIGSISCFVPLQCVTEGKEILEKMSSSATGCSSAVEPLMTERRASSSSKTGLSSLIHHTPDRALDSSVETSEDTKPKFAQPIDVHPQEDWRRLFGRFFAGYV